MTDRISGAPLAQPTPKAVLAMYIWGHEYSRQIGGSMDFWDLLDASRKRVCRDGVKRILQAHRVHGGSDD